MILAAKYIAVLWGIPLGREFVPISAPINLNVLILSIVGLLIFFIPCYLGIQLGAVFASMLGIVSMVPLTLLIFLPFFRPSTLHWGNVAGFRLADPEAGTFVFFISWIFILTWSVLGTEASACYIGECRNPARDARIAMSASGFYGSLIYVAIPLLLVAVLGRSDVDSMTAFVAYTEAIFGSGNWVKWIIGIPCQCIHVAAGLP
jgi:amino acid transporter